MSWIRSAVSKAVEVGGKNNLTRTVRNYADSVVQQAGQAVAEGAKLLQDRIGARNFKSFRHTVKRLEEVAVSCRGEERLLLLRRWLVALKDIERISAGSLDEKEKDLDQTQTSNDSMDSRRQQPSLVLYYDSDLGGVPMNFKDVFLHSLALEGITMSMMGRRTLGEPRPSKFEMMWLEATLLPLMKEWWESFDEQQRAGLLLWKKFALLKKKLNVWNRESFGHLRTKINVGLEGVASIDRKEEGNKLSMEEHRTRKILKEELDKLFVVWA
ncbi:Rootletin [Thalictrum thalictroides]|uniref:Rootletin n=1 Tax=Thalictrum thalictroides TaxID=46969 RepID=A0A7J6WLS5_THATH|nr:Rootletin [Thalictrum thalictroides]